MIGIHNYVAMRFSLPRIFLPPFLALTGSISPAFSQGSVLSLFPGGMGFAPLRASHEEARVGLQQELGSSRLHVQIGNAIDAAAWVWGGDTLRLGADFIVYALSSTFGDYRFKIDAADGIFGIHLSCRFDSLWSARFRTLHYSAHLVDGRFDTDRQAWTTDRLPFPFSRNFGELTLAFRPSPVSPHRMYAGLGLSVFTKPRAIRAGTAHVGLELAAGSEPHWYCAYHGSLLGVPAYVVSNTIEAGLKLGRWDGAGLRIFLAYHGGLEWYGQYYNERGEFFGGGIAIDY